MTPDQLELTLFLTACALSGILLTIVLELIDRRKVHQPPRRSTFWSK
jgi:hypothetical protein